MQLARIVRLGRGEEQPHGARERPAQVSAHLIEDVAFVPSSIVAREIGERNAPEASEQREEACLEHVRLAWRHLV